MQTYQLSFRVGGRFQSLPDSQTIFGALCWAIRDLYGEAKLTEMLGDFPNHPQRFVVSSMFYKDQLPLPPLTLEINSKDIESLAGFQQVKKVRKLKWCSVGFLEQWLSTDFNQKGLQALLLKNDETVFKLTDEVIHLPDEQVGTPQVGQEFSTRNQINRLTGTTGDEGQLFYQDVQTVSTETKVQMYVQTSDQMFVLSLFKYLSDSAIGRDKSIGMNQFVFETMEVFEFKNDSHKPYLISKYLPFYDEIDWESENLLFQTFSANYIVESRQNFSGEHLKSQLVYLSEGSILPKQVQKELYGQLPIVHKVDGQPIYQNGLGLFL